MGGIAPSPITAVILSESPPRFHRKIRAVSTTIQNAQRKTGRAVKNMTRSAVILGCLLPAFLASQEMHDHPPPEKLGTVSFATSCKPETNQEFNRAVALLHSFAYKAAEEAFQRVTQQDPQCAIAHWGIAMTHYHPLWEPVLPPAGIAAARQEINRAATLEEASERERGFIRALSLVFNDAATIPYSARALNYERAMRDLAAANPRDVETQVFYALALISNASPSDKEHRRQKQAADLLEPLYIRFPDHPGIPHYLIHACDNQELASRGLAAARAYSKIAPSAPHALHMPSHIFTRLGLWDDSIASNLAARAAAEQQGDTGEELHAMDYLVYAYLQSGRDQQAARVIEQLKAMPNLDMADFKIGYAATAMPIRYIVERQQWSDAEKIVNPPDSAQPHVLAIAVWARGLGFARSGHIPQAEKESATLQLLKDRLRASGNDYWATQVDIMRREVAAWSAQAANQPDRAAAILRTAADDEDGIEKLPVTPGPIIPARQQLGELLLRQGDLASASKAFQTALENAPGRRGALQGAALAAHSH
jgi:tetratricopeptide (TPR) repeat protein